MDLYHQQYTPIDYIEYSPFDNRSRIGGITNWKPEAARILKTFLVNSFPFDIPLNILSNEYTARSLTNLNDCNCDIVKLIVHRIVRYGGRSSIFTLDEILELYYPTEMDMTVIVLKIMLDSGWNKETVLSIDPESSKR